MTGFYASHCGPSNSDLTPLSSTASVNYPKIVSLAAALAGSSWGAKDAAHGESDNQLVIRRRFQWTAKVEWQPTLYN
jgi:hypothetical protein